MRHHVYLRIYDLSNGFVKTWSPLLLMKRIEGMWHTGVHAYGNEYFYGGGIVKLTSDEVEAQYDMLPVRVEYYGETKISQRRFEKHLLSIRNKFHNDFYDLTRWNCNHFSDYILKYLVGKGAPQVIVNMPSDVESTLIGKLVISAIKRWSDGDALIHSDDPMHPKNEMLRRGNQYIAKDTRGRADGKQIPKITTIGLTKFERVDVVNSKGEEVHLDLPPSPSLRLSKQAELNRLELIDLGWMGTPDKELQIGSPTGIGRAIGGKDPESPTFSALCCGFADAFPAGPSFGISASSPVKPDGLLPTPPSKRYASTKDQRCYLVRSPLKPPDGYSQLDITTIENKSPMKHTKTKSRANIKTAPKDLKTRRKQSRTND
eukprot:GHVH01003722.1.p1 GENE.GHVH01003722.1~~GHVH01003722.1.p1  ORF type:complete len:374 (+),score=46.09 GHVH01003722.1:90-1211(+)